VYNIQDTIHGDRLRTFRQFALGGYPTIGLIDNDFRGLDCIQLEYACTQQKILDAMQKNLMFLPVSVMSPRQQNRICFLMLRNTMALS
jgi:hypothetical protein